MYLDQSLTTYLDQTIYLVGLNFGLSMYLDHTFGLDFRSAKAHHSLAATTQQIGLA